MGLPYRYMSIDVSTTTMTLMLRRALGLGANLPFHIEDSLLSLTQANATSSLARVPGLLNRGNVSVVAAAQSCYSFLPTRGGMARLSKPRASVCKFPAHGNHAVTQVVVTGFEPGTVRLRIQGAINCAIDRAYYHNEYYSGMCQVSFGRYLWPILFKLFSVFRLNGEAVVVRCCLTALRQLKVR